MHVEMFALVLETEWIEKKERKKVVCILLFLLLHSLESKSCSRHKEKVQDDDGDGKQAGGSVA